MRALLLASILSAVFVSEAAAQAGNPWLIVPTTSTLDDSQIEAVGAKVRNELIERGIEVWSFDAAAARFEAEGSAPAAEVTEGDMQKWVERSSEAIQKLARGDYSAALEQLNQAQRLTRSAAEELNREKQRSRQVLDTCLYMVRALLETGGASRANSMIQECRRLVPRGEPSQHMHPPKVVEMLKRVDDLGSEQSGSIRVGSLPSACAVRVNGVMVGETPLTVRDMFPGRYRVQVECEPERRGRVHVADVVAGPTDVFVDLRFDNVVETAPIMHLRYPNASEREAYRVADAQLVADLVPAGGVVLLASAGSDALDLELYRGTPLVMDGLARVPVGPRGPSTGDIALAARTLEDGRCMDFTGPEPTPLPCAKPAVELAVEETTPLDTRPADRMPRGRFIPGLTLVGVGTASLVTGYALMIPRKSAGEDWVRSLDTMGTSDSAAQEKWQGLGAGIIASASIGGAALVTAMPLVLPKRAKTPWWAWLSGGLGVGAVAASAYIASTVGSQGTSETSCSSGSVTAADARVCVRRGERTSLAILTGVTAAPLLTMPLVYLLRPSRMKLSPELEVSRAGGFVSMRGQF